MYFKSMDLQHYLLNNILKFKFLGYFWHEEIIMLLLFKLRILFILYWKSGLWVWTFWHTIIHSKNPIYLKMKVLVVQLCLTIFDPRDCSLPGSSVHGFFQATITGVGCHFLLQGIFLTQGSNHMSCVSCNGSWIFLPLAAPGKPTAQSKTRSIIWLLHRM